MGYLYDLIEYWAEQDAFKGENGSYPDHVHDFISIHPRGGRFNLLSPMCVVDHTGGKQGTRPRWEDETFPTMDHATRVAFGLAALYTAALDRPIAVVDCTAQQAPAILHEDCPSH